MVSKSVGGHCRGRPRTSRLRQSLSCTCFGAHCASQFVVVGSWSSSHVARMSIACSSHVARMLLACCSHVARMQLACSSHVARTLVLHVVLMDVGSRARSSHVGANSHPPRTLVCLGLALLAVCWLRLIVSGVGTRIPHCVVVAVCSAL